MNTNNEARIEHLLSKIPVGTFCDETNNCGGYLTQDETDELEALLTPAEDSGEQSWT